MPRAVWLNGGRANPSFIGSNRRGPWKSARLKADVTLADTPPCCTEARTCDRDGPKYSRGTANASASSSQDSLRSVSVTPCSRSAERELASGSCTMGCKPNSFSPGDGLEHAASTQIRHIFLENYSAHTDWGARNLSTGHRQDSDAATRPEGRVPFAIDPSWHGNDEKADALELPGIGCLRPNARSAATRPCSPRSSRCLPEAYRSERDRRQTRRSRPQTPSKAGATGRSTHTRPMPATRSGEKVAIIVFLFVRPS